MSAPKRTSKQLGIFLRRELRVTQSLKQWLWAFVEMLTGRLQHSRRPELQVVREIN